MIHARFFQAAKFLACMILLATPLALRAQEQTASATPEKPRRAAWMQQAKWGIMTHYLADWQTRDGNRPRNGEAQTTATRAAARQERQSRLSPEIWNKMVDGFDVEGLADQIKSTGAGYHILTIGQNSGYFDCPNETYDKLTGISPSRLSRRDLISDMADAEARRGIKLIVYLPSGGPGGDRAAVEKLQWHNGAYPNKEFQKNWEAVIADWSRRWGTKVSGWWFDGCYWPNTMYRSEDAPNFKSFAEAARAGNPMSAVAFNPGVVPRLISMSPYEDYTAGETSDPKVLSIRRSTNGILDGAQVQILSYLGTSWGSGTPRFTTEEVLGFCKTVREPGGAITWDVPVGINGHIAEPFMDQLKAIGEAMNAASPPAKASSTQE